MSREVTSGAGTAAALLLAGSVGFGMLLGSACEERNARDRASEEARRDRCAIRCGELGVLYTKVVDGKGETCGCGVEK